MVRKSLYAGAYSAFAVNALGTDRDGELLALTFFDRSRTLCKAIAGTIAQGKKVVVDRKTFNTAKQQYAVVYTPVQMGRDRFILTTLMNKGVGKDYLITDEAHLDEDFYNILMKNCHLPLLKEWTGVIREELLNQFLVRTPRYGWQSRYQREDSLGIELHGMEVPADQLLVYDFRDFSEGGLQEIVTCLIREGRIRVAERKSLPLEFENFDGYITKYGASLVGNLEGTIDTLSPLKGDLDGFAAKHKRLYPQQAACINGIIALKKANSRYGLMVEGMGCGKTLQGAATVDAYFNQKWLEAHPGTTLRDLYQALDQPVYRNVLMAPSHLIAKWKEEILKEIPGSSVTILSDLPQLLALREKGRRRTGREWYLLSKDFCKLGSQDSPIPTVTAKMIPKGAVCKDCLDEGVLSWKTSGDSKTRCKTCGGRKFVPRTMVEYGRKYGLVCPCCGNLLIRPSASYMDAGKEKEKGITLKPEDFASHTSINDTCLVCGTHLWGADCKPLGTEDTGRKWRKISHYKNFQRKGMTTAWVLKGHEKEYLSTVRCDPNDYKVSPVQYGPRRFAPSQFIKKYLKGFFDFVVLDEAHKYEHGGTAQAVAAHALMGAGDFTLCLTGTISNGRADSFFYLLYMLDPRRMRAMGYEYSDVMQFSKTYGSVETIYEATGDEEGVRNAASRGRQIQAPRVKPGISPKLFTDFLLDKSVFLDLSDLSKYLPPLKEKVVVVDCPDVVSTSYDWTINTLKETIRQKGGRSLLSTMLQFGLSYPDKPYGRKPIMHPYFPDHLVCRPEDHKEYAGEVLLPKEEKLVELVSQEIAEDRNCFVYCSYTGDAEMNVTPRLQEIIERCCNLRGQVLVMNAQNPKATEREAFIKKKAAEGIRVFICNMRLVETGLDFCFEYDGGYYNYPTIIFYQMSYELAVMWQASRRHYRLNQREECRTYYLVTDGTLQMGAVQVMAEKQMAASAIQGKFSADGLSAMAKSVDPRIRLAQMLSEKDAGLDRASLENMFDVMAHSEDAEDTAYADYTPPKTYYEIMEGLLGEETGEKTIITALAETEAPAATMTGQEGRTAVSIGTQLSVFDLLDALTPVVYDAELLRLEQERMAGTKKKAKKQLTGQMSLFDLAA